MIAPATLPRAAPARVLACGAYLKNRACLIEDDQVWWSTAHGDLSSQASREALDVSAAHLLRVAAGPVQAIAHDLHPDFHSTRLAWKLAGQLGVPAIGVQHHHAHIAAVQAEQPGDQAVIGIALDGTGLGDDGGAWGGELLWVDTAQAAHQWRRLDHLAPLQLPGGDLAAREPWRMAAAVLQRLGRAAEIQSRFAPLVGGPTAAMVAIQLRQGIHCPETSSAGRWFDAAAGALGIALRQRSEAEAAMALEHLAAGFLARHPGFVVPANSLDPGHLVGGLFSLAGGNAHQLGQGAATFHLGLASGLAQRALTAAHACRTGAVAFGGGCFMNRILSCELARSLQAAGLVVLEAGQAGCGDAGLALGQAWAASCAVAAAVPRATLGQSV